MQHNHLILIVEFGSRVTPTEIRIEVLKPDRCFRRDYDRVKPCRIRKQQANLPLVSKGLNTIYQPERILLFSFFRLGNTQSLSRKAPAQHLALPSEPIDLCQLEPTLL